MEISHYIQLIIGLVFGIGLFTVGLVARERTIMWLLLLLIPFQPIATRYGSVNEVLVYMAGMAFLLRGRISSLPFSGSILFILFAYFLALTQAPRFAYFDQVVYLVAIGSNFILFYLVYNFVVRQGGWQDIWWILVVLNVLVLGYCTLQMFVGFGDFKLLGLSELSIEANRAAHRRLTGPFAVTAMTAEYFVIQMIMLLYAGIRETKNNRRWLWAGLGVMNFGFIVATGNRGGVVALAIGVILFFYLFRKELGVARIILISVTSVVMLAATSIAVTRFTEFNVLFERFAATEIDGVMLDTRKDTWTHIWPRIIESPIIGHGPRLRLSAEKGVRRPGYEPLPYPHNLYMYVFYTLGVTGLLAYFNLFIRIGARYYQASRGETGDDLLDGIPRVALVVLAVFAASEFRMEMLRFEQHDYQQYFFMVLAAFLALSDCKRKKIMDVNKIDIEKQEGRILSIRRAR